MRRLAMEMTVCNMYSATMQAKQRVQDLIKRAEEVQSDPRKKERLERHECIACFYSGRIGGAMMTERPCGICGTDQMYASTATGALCLECAKKRGLCRHCGGDLQMKVRRKWPIIENVEQPNDI